MPGYPAGFYPTFLTPYAPQPYPGAAMPYGGLTSDGGLNPPVATNGMRDCASGQDIFALSSLLSDSPATRMAQGSPP